MKHHAMLAQHGRCCGRSLRAAAALSQRTKLEAHLLRRCSPPVPAARADVFMVHGLFAQTLKPPLTPGSEGVGTVASFSERFSLGQRVVAGGQPAKPGRQHALLRPRFWRL
jgi:hypothetical protein